MNDATEATPRGGIARHPLGMLLIGLSSGLLVAYGIGLWQRNAALTEQATTFTAQIAAKDAELAAAAAKFQETQGALTGERSRVALVEARMGLYRALNDLDARNFGIANDRLRESARVLGTVDAAALNLDPAQVSAIAADVGKLDLLVASDLQGQRLAVLELAARLEGLAPAGG
jgi:hypothetical protein